MPTRTGCLKTGPTQKQPVQVQIVVIQNWYECECSLIGLHVWRSVPGHCIANTVYTTSITSHRCAPVGLCTALLFQITYLLLCTNRYILCDCNLR